MRTGYTAEMGIMSAQSRRARVSSSRTRQAPRWKVQASPYWTFREVLSGSRKQTDNSEPMISRRDLRSRITRSEEHTSELQSQSNLVCRLLLEKKKNKEQAQQSLEIT